MGKFWQKTNEDEVRMRDYEEEIARDPLPDTPLQIGEHKLTVKWYQWLIFDIRARIVYGTLLGIFLGVGVTLMIYYWALEKSEQYTYGSCLINEGFRFECLINTPLGLPPTEEECVAAMCCYAPPEEDVPFRCYHYFTPAYQYFVNELEKNPDPETLNSSLVQMNLRPRYGESIQTPLEAVLRWRSNTHLTLDISDQSKSATMNEAKQRSKQRADAELWAEDLEPIGPFDVSFSERGEYFFVRVGRKDTGVTLFDTRLGPLISDLDEISFATVLPSKWFYGLKGGQGYDGQTYESVSGYGNLELPFYLAFEPNGDAHGVLIETQAPFLTQYVEAPGLLFHFQGQDVGIQLHFFVGPTPQDVFGQLHDYLNDSEGIPTLEMPPYWGLGLHLCRSVLNETFALEQMLALEGNETRVGIPYDSDCIDNDLRTPFDLDTERFDPISDTFGEILELMTNGSRRLLLTQSIALFNSTYESVVMEGGAVIMDADGMGPFAGILKGREVLYPDFMNNSTEEWVQSKLQDLSEIGFPISGLVILDNFPRNENLTFSTDCPNSTTGLSPSRLQERFNQEVDGRALVCPQALHGDIRHFDVHNVYGHAALVQINSAFEVAKGERRLMTSASVWSHSSVYGGFSGLAVPFTWPGLVQSLEHVLRNFMTLPFSGTPICGSYPGPVEVIAPDELCLRWFQLGLLLPFARSSYGVEGTLGPRDLSLKYQNYLAESIRNRYMYSPYYYTNYYLNTLQRQPLVRPLVYDFHGLTKLENMAGILTQFMIGPAIMATPVLTQATTRSVYFPPGQWYDPHGSLIAAPGNQGTTLTISSVASETPIFLRGGYIIPVLANISVGDNAMQSRASYYTILATFPRLSTETSTGELFVDDGVSRDSIETNQFDHVSFAVNQTAFTLETITCVDDDMEDIYRIITEIRIFGFPASAVSEIVSSDPTLTPNFTLDTEERVLWIFDFELHWCRMPDITFTWIITD